MAEKPTYDELEKRVRKLEKKILETRQAYDGLKQSEQKWQHILLNSPQVVISLDPKGRILFVNQHLLNISGWRAEEVLNGDWFDMFIPQEIRGKIQEIFRATMLQKHTLHHSNYENEIITRNGELKSIYWSNTLTLDEQGNVAEVSCLGTDITEIKKIEDTLRASERKFRALFEQSNACCLLLKPTSSGVPEIVDVNETACRTHGYTREEMIGRPVTDIDDDEGKRLCIERTRQLLDNKSLRIETVHLCKNGKKIHMAIYANLIQSENMEPLILSTEYDISDIKNAEAEKKTLTEHLRQAQKMEAIGTLAGGIAHDFNNILAVILGYTEMARDDSPKGSSVAKYLDQVLEASNRAKGIVQRILAFSRQDDSERITFQTASIVKETIKMLRSSLPTTIEIIHNIDSATGLIFANPTQINQILMNLCTNAFHAMEKTGGRLDISLKEINLGNVDVVNQPNIVSGAFVQLSICDSGKGIPPWIKDKIFDPYFTTKEPGKGTGMGLSIVHGIVKSYGGFISFDSELGKGTTFDVFLPVAPKATLPETDDTHKIPTGNEKILFIDDEERVAEMAKDMLERLGYHVTVRTNSSEALGTFQNFTNQFDLVITDQTMPGMTGTDIAKRMLQIRHDIPIILCTGYSAIISEEEAKSFGIREYALKPLSKKNLAELIRKVLDAS
jgi:PAS domain S-box-containing protein